MLKVLPLLLTVLSVTPVFARDEFRLVSPSKVAANKAQVREKLMGEWTTDKGISEEARSMRAKGKQLIFFEYSSRLDKWRGLYSDKVKLTGYSFWCFYFENEATAKMNEEMAKGLTPAFIAREGAAYAMLFVRPEDLSLITKELETLGVSPPKVK